MEVEVETATVGQYQTLVRFNNPVLVVKHPEKETIPTKLKLKRPPTAEEILNSILPPRCWVDEGQMWQQRVSSTPATRQDGNVGYSCPLRRELYSQCFVNMSDTATERNSNSKTNLIDVQHVGVTAKLQSPLKNFMLTYSSSTESDNNQALFGGTQNSNTKYNKFLNEAANETDTTITECSKVLYEMKTVVQKPKKKSNYKLTPSKIEFRLCTKPKKRLTKNQKTKKLKRQLFENENNQNEETKEAEQNSVFQRLKVSFNKMKATKAQQQGEDKIFPDLPEPENLQNESKAPSIGIYPFEYGCAEYLKTHDCPPQIMSLILAERATHYATRFWAEFFGSLQIGVAFIVTFLLQTYRFVLYSLVNVLLVEFLHMTSDYLIKPLLTVLFNGFLQPPLIFCFNILASIRDILEPIADTINNFMKPLATVARSLRLVHATYNKKNITKNV